MVDKSVYNSVDNCVDYEKSNIIFNSNLEHEKNKGCKFFALRTPVTILLENDKVYEKDENQKTTDTEGTYGECPPRTSWAQGSRPYYPQ